MNRNFNLPPGVDADDIEQEESENCPGCGALFMAKSLDPNEVCPRCAHAEDHEDEP